MGTLDFPQALCVPPVFHVPVLFLYANGPASLQIPSLSIVVGLMLVSEPSTAP